MQVSKEIVALVMSEAAKSNVEQRKVGCVIVHSKSKHTGWLGVVAKGYNYSYQQDEVEEGCVPLPDLHAEAMACKNLAANEDITSAMTFTAYVTHTPCPACAELLLNAGVTKVEVVTEFLKFDGDKLRYDLMPPSSLKALASVLTFGARKYKPNNWRTCKDLDRYIAATMRHFEAHRAGELFDVDSGYPHLWHAMANLAFLIELTPGLGEK